MDTQNRQELDSLAGLSLDAPNVEEKILAACLAALAEPGMDCIHLFLPGDEEVRVEKDETVQSLKEKLDEFRGQKIEGTGS